jgi:hypothetical protein
LPHEPVEHSVDFAHMHCWFAKVLFGKHTPVLSERSVQHPFAAGHWLLAVQVCAQTLVPVPSFTQVVPAAQQFEPQALAAAQHAPATQACPVGQVPAGSWMLHFFAEQTQFRNAEPEGLHVCDPLAPSAQVHACVAPGEHVLLPHAHASKAVPALLHVWEPDAPDAHVQASAAPGVQALAGAVDPLEQPAMTIPTSARAQPQRIGRILHLLQNHA